MDEESTPLMGWSIKEYIEDNKSKLMKIDELLDLSLDKAIKELKEDK
jgi:hypothetical protein